MDNTGVITDRNGHGTHCAGIAAAVGNNGIGITGANPDALIMPVQVLDKSGYGTIATTIKGIDYAAANGADVLSMSFGNYCFSSAEQETLLKAYYAGAYLVAAAGNDKKDIYTFEPFCDRYHCFPGAFKFVIGVMATDERGNMASFSNYDSDGPLFSEYDNAGPAFFGDYYNYDVAAPGVNIMSTFPNGSYYPMSGTSMSTPLVAGALSRLLQCRTFSSQENCQGLLIQTRDTVGNIDVKAAYEFDEIAVDPVLVVTHYSIIDTIDGGNGDGIANPGETLEIYPTVQCVYGQANGLTIHINQGLNVDTTALTILKNDARVGYNLSPGATLRSKEPIVVKVAERCGDGYTIQLYPTIMSDSMQTVNTASAYAHKLEIKVEDKAYLSGVLTDTLTLTPDRKYIVNKWFAMTDSAVLNIMPGTHILLTNRCAFAATRGKLNAVGKPDSMIVFEMAPGNTESISYITMAPDDTIQYAIFNKIGNYEWGLFRDGTLKNCVIKECYHTPTYYPALFWGTDLYNCNIVESQLVNGFMYQGHTYYCNIINNQFGSNNDFSNHYTPTAWGPSATPHGCNIYDNYMEDGTPSNASIPLSNDIEQFFMDIPSYFGSDDEEEIRKGIWDIHQNHGLGEFVLTNRLKQPSKNAHGIVWKLTINDEEVQTDYSKVSPLGVGTHKFCIYYNRPMDVSVKPTISFGLRTPYTQHFVEENASWSADSTIFTAYITITGRTMTDGINHILITGGRDDEFFEIPEETHRFNMIVQATGSLSTGLYTTAGLGKVSLQWRTDEEDYEDLLGYDIYRWTDYKDSVWVDWDENGNYIGTWKYVYDTTIVNNRLLEPHDSTFIDYAVTPGKAYYYQIKQVTTSFANYNFSNPVSCVPLTASKGDANGSMTVDVADVVTEIAYLTNDNPQPFIFEAADVNSDGVINILDVVGTINIITHPQTTSLGFSDNNTAVYTIEDGILYVETPVVLGGVQFTFIGDQQTASFQPLEALQGFEQVSNWTDSDTYTFLAYSMSGKTLGIGKHALLRIGDAAVENIVLSNPRGQNVPAIQGSATAISVAEAMQMQSAYPNPFTTEVIIPYIIGQTGTHNVRFVFTNVAGLVVDTYSIRQTFGEYTYTWHPATSLPAGVYFVTLYVDDKALQVSKLVRSAE